jgi:hypothetical protein
MTTELPPETTPAPQPARKHKKGLGIASLVLGIVAVATAFIPFWSYAVIGVGSLALILGIVALITKRGKKAGIAGTILGAVGLILAIVATTIYAAIFFAVDKSVKDFDAKTNEVHTVVLEATGDAKNATITYSTNEQNAQETDKALPWTKTVQEKAGIIPTYSIDVSNGTSSDGSSSDSGSVTCTIKVDDKVVKTSTASGQFASATCSYYGDK